MVDNLKQLNKDLLKEMEKRELNPMGSGTDMDQFMLDKIENFKKTNKIDIRTYYSRIDQKLKHGTFKSSRRHNSCQQ